MPSGLFWDGDRKFDSLSDAEKLAVETHRLIATQVIDVGTRGVYFPTPITGGRRAFDVAERYGLKSIAEVKEKLGGQVLLDEVIKPNIAEARARADAYKSANPSDALVVPTGIEGMVRAMESRGQRWSEAGFMAFWLDVINHHIGKMVAGDGWALSNGTTEEIVEATSIQAGLRQRAPELAVVNASGEAITLDQRAAALAEAVKLGLGRGLDMPAQATGLARLLHIHDMIADGRLSPAKADPALFDYDMGRMERLKAEMRPVLEGKCARTMTLDGLDDGYRAPSLARLPITQRAFGRSAAPALG